MRVLTDKDPFAESYSIHHWERGRWPANWVNCPGAEALPHVTAYRLRFQTAVKATARIHVTADERYELFLDGCRVGRGSDRGDSWNWFYDTHDLALDGGEHVLVARVWALGEKAPFAQMSVCPGFLLAGEGEFGELLSTGVAPWQAKVLDGYEFTSPKYAFGAGWNLIVDGRAFAWGFETGDGAGWADVEVGRPGLSGSHSNEIRPGHQLCPSTLPAMMDEPRPMGRVRFAAGVADAAVENQPVREADLDEPLAARWRAMLAGEAPLTVPPHTCQRVIVDLDNYYCAYPEVTASGGAGASVRMHWAEALFESVVFKDGTYHETPKGNRDQVFDKYFVGLGDVFLPDGAAARRFDTLWWQAGRYVELLVQTDAAELTIDAVGIRETRYPVEMASRFAFSDERLTDPVDIMVRGLQMCSHETYFDCPFYEQLMYTGDTRLEVLATYAVTGDDRLPRKALRMYDASRIAARGLSQSRYPSRVTQFIPPFTLWWTAMVHDYALWRDDEAFVRARMPGVRQVLDHYLQFLTADGLLDPPEGLQFTDWVPGWRMGIPPAADPAGISGLLNWQLVLALSLASRLEGLLGEQELAERRARQARELGARVQEAFWDERRGLFADSLDRKAPCNEHGQCLAILSGVLDESREAAVTDALLGDADLERTTIYFSHYLFETFARRGCVDALLDRLQLWFELGPRGFKTTFEQPGESRKIGRAHV